MPQPTQTPGQSESFALPGEVRMSPTIYAWSGDYFCSDCIVFALTEQEPWIEWLQDDDNDPTAQSTPGTLDLIAAHFNIGHNRAQREANHFPIRLRANERPDGTNFCRVCLKLLTMESDHAQ